MFNGIVIGLEFDIYEVLLNMYCYSQSEFQDGCHRRTDNTMTKRKSTKGQTTTYKTYI
jgi:hypothetical protein